MAKKLNPETATIREVAELYATEQKLDMSPKAYGNLAASYLPQGYADQPGSALGAFMTGDDGDTLLKGVFTSLDLDVTNPKTSMQALRMMGLRLKKDLPANSNLLPFLPDEAPDTPKNEGIFGIKEPPKSVSEVAILTDKATMQEMFRQIMVIAQDPKQEAAAMATLFNLQNGLRPNAAGMLRTDSYYPESRAIYIPAEAKGAKGRKVNVPLNDIADSILQMRLQSGAASESYFFVKPNGNPVKSNDITDILAQVKIPKLIYDSGLKEYFNSLAPDYEKGQRDTVPGKRGSPLIRNIHTKIAQRNGVPFERIAYLQGRSLKAAAEGSVGEVTTYAQDYPGDLEAKGPDVRNANVVSSYFAEAAEDAGFSIPESLGVPTQRVGRATPGYEKYFDSPAVSDAPVASPIKVTTDAAEGGISPELLEKLKKNPTQLRNYLDMLEAKGVDVSKYRNSALIATILSTLTTGAKAAMSVIPPVSFEMNRRDLIASGMDPAQAAGQAFIEEASTPIGVLAPLSRAGAEAVVEASKEPFQEETGMKLTDKNLGRGIVSKITGGFSYSSGGFIEKRR